MGLNGWLTCLHKCMLTLSVSEAKGMSPLDIPFFWWIQGRGSGKGCLYDLIILVKRGYWYNDYPFFPYYSPYYFNLKKIPLPNKAVTRP